MKHNLQHNLQKESGALSIEAVISLTFFMLAIIAIMFISLIVKIQSTMQYALSQTAKEISGYYYLLDKTGLTKITAGLTEEHNEAVELTNQAIGNVIDFSSEVSNAKGEGEDFVKKTLENGPDLSTLPSDLKSIGSRGQDVVNAAQTMVDGLQQWGDDAQGQLKGIFAVFSKTMANSAVSYCIAPFVCRMIMPRYLAGDKQSSNDMLEAMGVQLTGKTGLESLDFSQSELLTDRRSIKLVVTYKINPEKITLGFIKVPEEQWPVFRQTACTAAWISPDDVHTISVANTADK